VKLYVVRVLGQQSITDRSRIDTHEDMRSGVAIDRFANGSLDRASGQTIEKHLQG
jgi:hypothetical protein